MTLAKIIRQSLENKGVDSEDVQQNNDIYCHFDYHSKYNSLEESDLVDAINADIRTLAVQLKKSDFIFLTLGTAIVHTLQSNGAIVGNCHKFPAQQFTKRMLTVDELKHCLSGMVKNLQACNPKCKIIFTISPVRHIKEGLQENAQSKARLLAAVSELQESMDIGYFPSYEIMQDELRDYRFYKSDLIHPNKKAIKYIWEIFGAHFFSEKTAELNKKLRRILVSSKHKAFHPKSSHHQKFLRNLLTQIDHLEQENVNISLNKIKKKVSKQLLT